MHWITLGVVWCLVADEQGTNDGRYVECLEPRHEGRFRPIDPVLNPTSATNPCQQRRDTQP